jgi:secreted trypsin-like serine protease
MVALLVGSSVARPAGAIVDGRDGGDAAVVALVRGEEAVCSGALVAPSVVLTAAHCVTPRVPDAVVFGASNRGGQRIAVSGTEPHPAFDRVTLAHDLALVTLAETAPSTIDPVPVATELGTDSFPSYVTLEGFGAGGPGDGRDGRKRSGAARVSTIDDERVELAAGPALSCTGDSGGAAFADIDGVRTLVGVISSGDLLCRRHSSLTRIDAALLARRSPPRTRRTVTTQAALLAGALALARLAWRAGRKRRGSTA